MANTSILKACCLTLLLELFRDPALILCVEYEQRRDEAGNPIVDDEFTEDELCSERLVCHVNLVDEAGEDRSTIILKEPERYRFYFHNEGKPDKTEEAFAAGRERDHSENLRGTKQSTGLFLIDPVDNKRKIFFGFADLSVRVLGDYRLVCHVFDMKRPTNIRVPLYTNEFRVYSPRTYPGNATPSNLLKSLALQGAFYPSRKSSLTGDN